MVHRQTRTLVRRGNLYLMISALCTGGATVSGTERRILKGLRFTCLLVLNFSDSLVCIPCPVPDHEASKGI